MPQYGDDDYWDDRYKDSETEHFEWYASFLEIEEKVTSAIHDSEARILVVGCGNSRFSEQMADAGYPDITSIDISEVVIKKMAAKAHALKWIKMDVREMKSFENDSFDFIFDKGTLDTMLCGQASEASALHMNESIHRVLAPGGVYMNMSYGEPAERTKHFSRPEYEWVVEQSAIGTYYLYKMTKPTLD